MAEKKVKTVAKPRSEKYEEKVYFEGTLEDMIKIAVKPIQSKPKSENK